MRWLVAAAALLTVPAFAAELESTKPYDDLWRASVQALVLRGIALDVNDKEGGIITGHFTDPKPDMPWFACERAEGKRWESLTTITLRISGAGDDEHRVEVRATAKEKWVKSKKIAFVRIKHIWTDVKCTSTGTLERLVLEEISSNLE